MPKRLIHRYGCSHYRWADSARRATVALLFAALASNGIWKFWETAAPWRPVPVLTGAEITAHSG
jgi:hypothetical protein